MAAFLAASVKLLRTYTQHMVILHYKHDSHRIANTSRKRAHITKLWIGHEAPINVISQISPQKQTQAQKRGLIY